MASIDYIKAIDSEAERRFFTEPVDFEMRADGEQSNVIEGYAAVFERSSQDLGGFHERIARGAFSNVLKDDAFALFNHDMNKVLGRNMVNVTLTQDDKGLRYRVELPDTPTANELRTLIKSKIITQSSFAFRVGKQEWEHPEDRSKPSTRTIIEMKRLYDVSPVTYPAYLDTTIAARGLKREEKRAGLTLATIETILKANFYKHAKG